ncbi:hypothetical protein QBC38DRAFT_522282 [Podospora fimiseda]|uniref:Crossover junction endonuclease MUS81 n=1 Tax=Podospora fimiseda TaxID=252190 RepID=A0AAN7H1D3_9PEZI|nr:hypothetical protein QBC38DRAFT_522282 [Podospora fimiseda]
MNEIEDGLCPSDLKNLKGWGDKLSQRLTKQLQRHGDENGLQMPTKGKRKRAARLPGEDELDNPGLEARPAQRPRTTAGPKKPYVPNYRSGPYAILYVLARHDPDSQVGMTREEIVAAGQPYCNASFTIGDKSRYHTAWNGINKLLDENLVFIKRGPVKRYLLTPGGKDLALNILEVADSRADNSAMDLFVDEDNQEAAIKDKKPKTDGDQYKDVVVKGETIPNNAALPNITPIRLAPASFTVELVIDNREIRSKADREYMQREFMKRGIKFITRPLALGDFIWVAKCNRPGWLEQMEASEKRVDAQGHRDTASDQVVLDWIVERKRLDDLIYSNIDGRYREQKFRLRRSGVKNVIYVVEHKEISEERYNRSKEAVETMVTQLQVVNGYFLKKTKNTDDTIKYLTSMTKMIQKMYEGKSLFVIRSKDLTAKNYLPLLKHLRETKPDMSHHIVYPAFASLCSKSEMMTLRDLFLKMLMCIKQLTGEKALEIQKIWKTPHEFIKAFEECGAGEEGRKKINMVADRLDHLYGNKKISRLLSEQIAKVWGDA